MKEGTMNGRKKSRKEGRMKKRLIMVGGMFGQRQETNMAEYQQLGNQGEVYMNCHGTITTTFMQVKVLQSETSVNQREDAIGHLISPKRKYYIYICRYVCIPIYVYIYTTLF